jgi:hypothetical protein
MDMLKDFIGLGSLVGLILIAGSFDYEEEVIAEQYYIDSVCLWYRTGGSERSEGRFGHPDYKQLGIECEGEL